MTVNKCVDLLPVGYNFVEASEVDPKILVELDQVIFSDGGYSADEIAELIGRVPLYSCVIDPGDNLMASGYLEADGNIATLDGLGVHPKHRGKGIGRALVKQRVDFADDIGIRELNTALASTNNLFDYYRTLGFREIPSYGLSRLRRLRPTRRIGVSSL